MKKIINWLKKGKSPSEKMIKEVKKDININEAEKISKTSGVCHHHNNDLFPNVKSIEHCEDCNTKMCYMCGSKHLMLGHSVKWKEYFQNLYPDAFKINDYGVGLLNKGYSGRLYLDNLECPCGNKITDHVETSAQCSACGTWTCSKECHDHYLAAEDKCTFHHNFVDDPMSKSMRSITLKTILNFQKAKMAPGTPVCKTSKSFMFATISDDDDSIFVQRGYRQYGNPLEGTWKNLEIYEIDDLDYVMHKDRPCKGVCDSSGKNRGDGPVYSCRNYCFDSETQIKQDFAEFNWTSEYCDCDCDFCSSGRINRTHTKMDCLLYCRNSEVAYRDGPERNISYLP